MGTTRHIALLRGVNVGRANRIAMRDLVATMEHLGFTDVRTLLASGNVVFAVPRGSRARPGPRIEQALAERHGITTPVLVLSAAELAAVLAENPFGAVATDPSRLLVVVFAKPADLARLEPLRARSWAPDQLEVGSRAAYLWCPRGLRESELATSLIGPAFRDVATSRNWATLQKLQGLTTG